MFDRGSRQALNSVDSVGLSRSRQINRAANSEAQPIDLHHLGRFTLGDKALETEVLGLYAKQLPETFKALKFAANNRDWMMAAHTLKGSSRAVGAWRLARLALQAEDIGTPLNVAGAGEVLKAMEAAAADVAHFIKTLSVGVRG